MESKNRVSPNLTVRLLAALAWLWLLIGLPFFTDAACDFRAFYPLAASAFVLGVLWVALTVAWPSTLQQPTRNYWLSIPLAGVLGLFLLLKDRDLNLRVWLSESALRDYVVHARPEGSDRIPRWVGLFRVNETQVDNGAVYLYTCQGSINRNGIAYIPPGRKPPELIWVKHLYGPWYNFVWRF